MSDKIYPIGIQNFETLVKTGISILIGQLGFIVWLKPDVIIF